MGGNNIRRAKLMKFEVGIESVSNIMTEASEERSNHLKNPNLSLPNEFSFLVKSFISFILS